MVAPQFGPLERVSCLACDYSKLRLPVLGCIRLPQPEFCPRCHSPVQVRPATTIESLWFKCQLK